MAIGHYRCSSNRAEVTDSDAIKTILSRYDTHNQVTLDNNRLTIQSPSDTLNVTRDGQGAQIMFLKELAPHLKTKLRVTNVRNPPRNPKESSCLIASPDGDVRKD